ncbi:hypothetical protein THRCLA_03916 [Thraustotheca clavata]|uniref:dihydrofolate reductase n=1 Tax=Thraustotheca clavata TaxID=74557 RepID=A0A1W0A0S3_9STRA|nr:hypothetical protein THRCLA_03916 [Thraustotheca clavata]
MQINIIAAVPRNRVIGCNGKLPWSLPKDWAYFLSKVKGHTSIMGRVCFGELNPNEDFPSIVVSQSLANTGKGMPYVEFTTSYKDALEIARKQQLDQVWIIGGQRIYEEALEHADKLYITRINNEYEGDTIFPEWEKYFTVLESRTIDTEKGIELAFEVWAKINHNV